MERHSVAAGFVAARIPARHSQDSPNSLARSPPSFFFCSQPAYGVNVRTLGDFLRFGNHVYKSTDREATK
eukprot:scaffold206954_cov28-Tisochrysis_lutea.AAC.1